jgi:hypothetical protein
VEDVRTPAESDPSSAITALEVAFTRSQEVSYPYVSVVNSTVNVERNGSAGSLQDIIF